jgi:hypothetical protein
MGKKTRITCCFKEETGSSRKEKEINNLLLNPAMTDTF